MDSSSSSSSSKTKSESTWSGEFSEGHYLECLVCKGFSHEACGQIFSLSNEELENAASSTEEGQSEVKARLEEDLNNACSIACGGSHVAVATDTGAVYTYGTGRFGQLGHGNKKDVDEPQLVEALRSYNITTVACGRDHTVAASSDGEVFFWGNRVDFVGSGGVSVPEMLPVKIEALSGVAIKQIACGAYHTAILAENGDLFIWGEYQADKNCSKCNHRDPFMISPLIQGKIVSIACGTHQTVAITEDHRVWAWGGGVLKSPTNGVADRHAFHLPAPIDGFDGCLVAQVACGDFNVLALTVHGEVLIASDLDFFKKKRKAYSSGQYYGFYSLGSYSDIPNEVDDSKPHRIGTRTVQSLFGVRILQVAVYRNTAMGLSSFGDVYTWTLPDPWRDFANESKPIKIDALQGILVSQVACGGEQTAILADEKTFLSVHLKHALNSPQFADVRIVVDGQSILAHKCILAARMGHWRALTAGPSQQIDGFRWDTATADGIDTLTFPSSKDNVFSYPVVLSLLQYIYTDKLVLPDEIKQIEEEQKKTAAQKNKGKEKPAKGAKDKKKPSQDEDEIEENSEHQYRKKWYADLERAGDYFDIQRLVQLCKRATQDRGFDITVESSSLAHDLRWLIQPLIDGFSVSTGSTSDDHSESDAKEDAETKAKAKEKAKEQAEAMKKREKVDKKTEQVETEYMKALENAHESMALALEKIIKKAGDTISVQERSIRESQIAAIRQMIHDASRARAERERELQTLRAQEKAEMEAKRRQEEKEAEEERKRQMQLEAERKAEAEAEAEEEEEIENISGPDIKELMVRERFADVEIVVGGVSLWAHKLVLTSSCEYFRLMFASGMRESELGRIDIEENVEPSTLAHLLAFLYTDSLSGIDANTAIDLVAVADQFMLPRMKRICEIRVQKDIDEENVAYVFQGADMYQAPRLRAFCLGFMVRNFDQVRETETYAALPPNLAAEVEKKVKSAGGAIAKNVAVDHKRGKEKREESKPAPKPVKASITVAPTAGVVPSVYSSPVSPPPAPSSIPSGLGRSAMRAVASSTTNMPHSSGASSKHHGKKGDKCLIS